MTWFSKPKNPEPVAPALCARCRARPGTASVHFIANPEAPSLDAADRTAWLCDACQADVRRESGDN